MMIYYVRLPNNKKTYKQAYDSRQELLQCLVDTEWREDVFNGIYKKVNRESSNYYLEGFCFMISFKILPFLRWLSYLNETSEYFDKSNVEKRLNDEILLWKKLIIILELEIRGHNVNIIKRIEVINNKIMINANVLAKGKSV